jgi:hypothetical protein
MQPIHSLSRPVPPSLDLLDADPPVDSATEQVEELLEAIEAVRNILGPSRTRKLLFQCSGALR